MNELIIVELEQGSPEWHTLRSAKRPASITPMIMGTSKFQDAGDAYDAMLGDAEISGFGLKIIDYGNRMEPAARKAFKSTFHTNGKPVVGYRGDYSASLDFLCTKGRLIAEIKCPFQGAKSKTWKAALRGEIEPGYADQMEHQFNVFRPEQIGLFVYLNDDEKIWVPYAPRPARWGSIQKAWDNFYTKHLLTFERPSTYAKREDEAWDAAALEYIDAKDALELAEGRAKLANEALVKLADGKKSEGCGVRFNTFPKRGSVDYKAAIASIDPEFNAEPFRKASTTQTTITLIEEKK